MTVISDQVSKITGTASPEVKALVVQMHAFAVENRGFGLPALSSLSITEVSHEKNVEEPTREEVKVVCQIRVAEHMINSAENLHGGCAAFLVDICTSLALSAYLMASTGFPQPNLSQSLNVAYHSPAGLGDDLRIVSTTVAQGARAMTARTEIWNVTKHRLAVSGVHIKMQPSESKSRL